MSGLITWEQAEIVTHHGRRRPAFAEDPGFTAQWWGQNADFTPPDYEWRSYRRDDEEIARALLSLKFPSHTGDPSVPALLIWNFEVRQDLQRTEEHVGTALVDALAAEYRDWEIYIGPTPRSKPFWDRFRWPMCDCEDCDGRGLIVRRPA